MFYNNKAISPVIALSLLLVVSVLSVLSFNSWVNIFSSSLFVDVEEDLANLNNIRIEGIYDDNLYIKSPNSDLFSFFKISNYKQDILCEYSRKNEDIFQLESILSFSFDNETFNGTHVNDLSNYNNTGKTNSADFIDNNCVSGNCFNFNGNNKNIEVDLDLNTKTYLNTKNNNLTFNAWIYKTNHTGGHDTILASESFRFQLDNNMRINLAWTNGSDLFIVIYPSSLELNKKYQITIVKNSSLIIIYINGKPVYNTPFNFNHRNLTNLSIGKDGLTDIGADDIFEGTIDEVGIYSRWLTENEVLILHNLQKTKVFNQSLFSGVNSIDISNCNLKKGDAYSILGFTESNKILELEVISK